MVTSSHANAYSSSQKNAYDEPPIIDLTQPESAIIPQIADACSTWGFFQVINHDVSPLLIQRFKDESQNFFDLPRDVKLSLKRDGSNSRGYFDDELTKQRRDWKEAIDVGVPGSRDWSLSDDDASNACLDGFNRFPPGDVVPNYRPTVVQYFDACQNLSDRIALLMAKGLGVSHVLNGDDNDEKKDLTRTVDEDETRKSSKSLVAELRSTHTSYLRTNYYPPYVPGETPLDVNEPPPLGISPHKDAGFLTVLLQDDDCHSLQVARFDSKDVSTEPEWVTVHPSPGAFTINTGDMAMIWSNGRYRAPLHRVLTATTTRITAPFFYNPGYKTILEPLRALTEKPVYHPCSWGYFRAVRFAGDFTDIGVEIQISDFECENQAEKGTSTHLVKQDAFLAKIDFCLPFDIERYRPLLEGQGMPDDR